MPANKKDTPSPAKPSFPESRPAPWAETYRPDPPPFSSVLFRYLRRLGLVGKPGILD